MLRPGPYRLVAALTSLLMVLGAALPLAGDACADGHGADGHGADEHGSRAAACCSAVHADRPGDACEQQADCTLSQDGAPSSADAYLASTLAVGSGGLMASSAQPFSRLGVQAVVPTQQQTTGLSSVALHLLYAVFLN